jgi:transcriptional regulator with XRE-family HTH domain
MSEKTYHRIGLLLKQARLSLSLTQTEFAKAAKVGKAGTISVLENGGAVSLNTFNNIRAALRARNALPPNFVFVPDGREVPRTTPTVSSSEPVAHKHELSNLHGYWLEIITRNAPELSIGHFHQLGSRQKYDGMSFQPNGDMKYDWKSQVFELDEVNNRILYSFSYGPMKGDGFGSIQLKSGSDGLTATGAYYVSIHDQTAKLSRLRMVRLVDKMKECDWLDLDVNSDKNRREFVIYLYQHPELLKR